MNNNKKAAVLLLNSGFFNMNIAMYNKHATIIILPFFKFCNSKLKISNIFFHGSKNRQNKPIHQMIKQEKYKICTNSKKIKKISKKVLTNTECCAKILKC